LREKRDWKELKIDSEAGFEASEYRNSVSAPIISVRKGKATECNCVRFEFFTAVAMKNGVFWDVTPGGSCKNRRFGGT
jgi:hypothetical protein